VSGSGITLEITESAAMENSQQAKNACLRLRMTGAGLSIDDFGTGFSSLQQLYDLPFSELKVDQALSG
jgi:EAL domain-containing protein (putative c-di-GMP-specific phosphodiesterase class I)